MPTNTADPFAWLAGLCATSWHAAMITADTQTSIAKSVLKLPPVALAVRNQIWLSEWALSFVASDVRTQRH